MDARARDVEHDLVRAGVRVGGVDLRAERELTRVVRVPDHEDRPGRTGAVGPRSQHGEQRNRSRKDRLHRTPSPYVATGEPRL